ncbi:MAG: response regulator transcription factor [Paludibacter sp.]|nr:response regulator transcription factor [Paludibacter sp.]
MIRVFIVDDHEIIRQGLKMILKEAPDLTVVGEAADGNEALKKLRTAECDVLVLDMNMPGKSGIELLTEIKALRPKLHILVLTIHPEDRFALKTLKAGASGYLCKDTALEELEVAIRNIYNKGRYISNTLAEQLAFEVVPDNKALHEQLSRRENEILIKITRGMKVKDIAAELNLSISTVFTYRLRIFEKLNVKSNVELTHYAIEHKLIN